MKWQNVLPSGVKSKAGIKKNQRRHLFRGTGGVSVKEITRKEEGASPDEKDF